jgi:peptidoglycan/xylan/chitin deacetylase (PgdA/CDA1 family)
MKILISHDVDHLSVKEHFFKDLIIPKYIFWSFLELVKGKIVFPIFLLKVEKLFRSSGWYNLEKLLDFDKNNNVNSTFFVAVNNGKGISYSLRQAKKAIDLIKKGNFDVGVHGISYRSYEDIKKEYDLFKELSGLDTFGIRMHYLRQTKETLSILSRVGYSFDTTVESVISNQEYLVGKMREVPFHLMDGDLFCPLKNYTLSQAKNKTKQLLDHAEQNKKKYVGILFHPRYFGDDFPAWKEWYLWLINYCREKKYTFSNYRNI